MEKEIDIYHISRNYPECKVTLKIGAGVTCAHVIEELLEQLELPESKSPQKWAWHLVERWKGCERRLSPNTPMLEVCGEWGCEGGDGVRVYLKRRQRDQRQLQQKRKKSRTKRLKNSLSSKPKAFLDKITYKRLQFLRLMFSHALRQTTKQQHVIMLSRLKGGAPLWGPVEPTVLDSMRTELTTLREQNLTFSTEISNLNIQSTRLRNLLLPLRHKSTSLSEQLLQLQSTVSERRAERDREKARETAETNTELLRLRRELELKNRLNSLQTAKLQSQKDKLSAAKTLLAEKQEEHGQLVARQQASHVMSHDDHMTLPETKVEDECDDAIEDHASGSSQTPPSPSKATPSTTKKRHFSVFEMKHRQLVEEEGLVFRQSHDLEKGSHDPEKGSHETVLQESAVGKLKSNTEQTPIFHSPEYQSSDLESYKRSTSDIHTEGPDVLLIPKPDQNWYENGTQNSPEISYRERILDTEGEKSDSTFGPPKRKGSISEDFLGEVMTSLDQKKGSHDPRDASHDVRLKGVLRRGRSRKVGVVKKVHFTAQSLILNAALEGDVELVRKCVRELGSCSYSSDKGATCLHNAVCSGDPHTVHYLVEMGCDVNAQDVDGWTPLHCAVAYSNQEMMLYLLEHGASLFLTTKDGETPLMIGEEECKLQGEGLGGGVNQATADCLQLIKDAQSILASDRKVFTLFGYKSGDPQELNFNEGECLKILSRGQSENYWWLAENARKAQALVPYTFLGSHSRYNATL